VVNVNTNPAGDSLHQDLWDLIRNTLIKGVTVGDNGGAANSSRFFTLYVPENSTNLRFEVEGGAGDLDLYVRSGARPTTSAFDCRSSITGSRHVCSIPDPAAGTYHAMLRGNISYSGVSITGNYD
jgi:serine protease